MKYAFVKDNQLDHSIVMMCKVLEVSRSGYYSWAKHELSVRQKATQTMVEQIKKIHVEVNQTYGSPRMHAELVDQGHQASCSKVARLMHKNDIQAKQSKRHTRTYKHRQDQVTFQNILDRQFHAPAPNLKWVSDITFIETRQGWLYLAIVLDLYSRAIVGWSMSDRLTSHIVRDALLMATSQRKQVTGTLVHSDQGGQYKSSEYQAQLEQHEMVCSMSRKGECHDNAVAESFFHTLKGELVNNANFKTRAEARQAIFKYIELFYNRKRRHSYLDYQAPLEYERLKSAA